MNRVLWEEEDGLEGLPLQLIIVTILITATVVPSLLLFEAYDRNNAETKILNELGFLAVRIQQVYLGGVGNAQTIEIELDGGFFSEVERVEIGDKPGGLWMTIRYKLSERSEKIISTENPVVPMGVEEGDLMKSLVLSEGHHRLRLVARDDYDFNQDGLDDLFVELKRLKN